MYETPIAVEEDASPFNLIAADEDQLRPAYEYWTTDRDWLCYGVQTIGLQL